MLRQGRMPRRLPANLVAMITHICDRCGKPIEKGALRYIARIQVYAASEPLEITLDDLRRDHREETDTLLRQCAGMTEEELMRDVYVEFQFDLCRACQRAYLAEPLPAA
jgi:hypothetical protein